jgi:hypothetical protein
MCPGTGLDRCGKSRPTGIRSPDLPARRQSLYLLSYPGSLLVVGGRKNSDKEFIKTSFFYLELYFKKKEHVMRKLEFVWIDLFSL